MNGWIRCTKASPCPICKRTQYCCVSADGSAILCTKEDAGAFKMTKRGWVHRVEGAAVRRPAPQPRRIQPGKLGDNRIIRRLWGEARSRTTWEHLDYLAAQLGVSTDSLNRLGAARHRGAIWSFPMSKNATTIIGLRYRTVDGKKWAEPLSRSGLFIPADLDDNKGIFITEGPTDTAAILDLGVNVIGRPDCNGGGEFLKVICQKRHVCIIADSGEAGIRGAADLFRDLQGVVGHIGVIVPPEPINDAREWVTQYGLTRDHLIALATKAFNDSVEASECHSIK